MILMNSDLLFLAVSRNEIDFLEREIEKYFLH